MNPTELAAALDVLADSASDLYQSERVLVSDVAQRLRELEAVRVAAVTYAVRTGHHEDCDESFGGDCECGHDALRAALARVGGGT